MTHTCLLFAVAELDEFRLKSTTITYSERLKVNLCKFYRKHCSNKPHKHHIANAVYNTCLQSSLLQS